MIYIWLSYLMVLLHSLCVLFIVLSVPVIMAGHLLQWPFVKNFYYRSIHLGMLMVPVVETILGLPCPLTLWENQLRKLGGLEEYSKGCLQYWMEQWFHLAINAQTVDITSLLIGISCVFLCFLVPPKFVKITSHHRRKKNVTT